MKTNFPRTEAHVSVSRDCAYYEDRITKNSHERDLLFAEWKDSGVWREKYTSWEETCSHFGYSKRHVDRLVKAVTNVITKSGQNVPSNDQLYKGSEGSEDKLGDNEPPEEPPKNTVQEPTKPQTKPPPIPVPAKPVSKPRLDKSGCIVPASLCKVADSYYTVKLSIDNASSLKCDLALILKEKPVEFSHVIASGTLKTLLEGAERAYALLRDCSPDIVCPECQGSAKKAHRENGVLHDWCFYCCGSGMISEVRWNRDWVKSNDPAKGAEVVRRLQVRKDNE